MQPAPTLFPCLTPSSLFAPLSDLTLDEDIIIALALSLSSSAFVLNLLDERKELGTTHGAATLGVLLMQVCACVRAHVHLWVCVTCRWVRVCACVRGRVCVLACVHACMRACVRACVPVRASGALSAGLPLWSLTI